MLRRKGFTLAEVLIALLLVGILSSISIQTLRNRDNLSEYEAIRNKAVTNVQGVLHEALYAEKSSEIFSGENGNYEAITSHLDGRLGIESATITGTDSGEGEISVQGQKMRDGSYYALTQKEGNSFVAELTIDVNGNKAPNKEGTDIFKYNVDKFGGILLTTVPDTESEKTCEEKDSSKPYMWKDGSCHVCPEDAPNKMSDGSCQRCGQDSYYNGKCNDCPEGKHLSYEHEPKGECVPCLPEYHYNYKCNPCPKSKPKYVDGGCYVCLPGLEIELAVGGCMPIYEGKLCPGNVGTYKEDISECAMHCESLGKYYYNDACNTCPEEEQYYYSGSCNACPEEYPVNVNGVCRYCRTGFVYNPSTSAKCTKTCKGKIVGTEHGEVCVGEYVDGENVAPGAATEQLGLECDADGDCTNTKSNSDVEVQTW